MELSEEDIQLIDLYINDKLSDELKKSFEERTVKDSDYGDSVHAYIDIIKAIRFREATALKEKLKSLESLEDRKKYRPVWYVAASVSLLIAAFIIFQNFNDSDKSSEDLYALHFKQYPNIEQIITRSENVVSDPYLLYDLANYEEAVRLFTEETPADRFYKAQCLMALERFREARVLLEGLTNLESKYTVPAKWYLALTSLRVDNIEGAKAYLEELSVESDYGQRAKDLMKAISEIDN